MVRNAEFGQDKRQLSRISCSLPLTGTLRSANLGEISDLSLDGLFVRTGSCLPVGATFPVAFRASEDASEIRAQAEVVRVTSEGMGLRFLSMDKQASRRLRRLVVDLTDVMGHKQMASRLMDTAGRTSVPIADAARIIDLLKQGMKSGTDFMVIPAEGSKREKWRLTQVSEAALTFATTTQVQLKVGEAVYALGTMDFVSYSFECRVRSSDGESLTTSTPNALFYSERRSTKRDLSAANVYLRVPLPWKNNAQASWQVFDLSSHGLSFRVPASETHFLAGTPLPGAVLSTGGDTVPLNDAIVKHLTLVQSEGDTEWIKVGVAFGVRRGVKTTTEHEIKTPNVASGRLRRIIQMGRALSTSTSYFLHRKLKRGDKNLAPHFRLVRFKNAANKQIVGLLNTSFLNEGRTRAPLVIIVPGFGGRKETFCALAMTIIDNFRRNSRDIAVLRIDGTNNLGESEKDPGCEAEGKHTLKYTMSGGIADVAGTLEWARSNKHVDPTDILIVSASFGTVPVRRILTTPQAAAVSRWFVLMGASDAQSIMLHGAGNLDIYGNYLRGIKMGVIQLVGCLADADNFCQDMENYQVATLEDARVDMGKIKADITWVLGKEDALADPRRVNDIMSVSAPGKREIIEVNAGHLPRSSDEALAQFTLVTQRIWQHLFGREVPVQVPSRGWLAAVAKSEWERVHRSNAVNSTDYWRTYLLGDGGLGFDILNLSPKYRGLVDAQVKLAEPRGKRVLDVGAGTGNLSETIATHGPAELTACDLIAEALERLKKKVEPHMPINTMACNIDGTATTLLRRWAAGDLHSPMELSGRLPGVSASLMHDISSKYDDRLHAFMRGFQINLDAYAQDAKLSKQQVRVVQDIHALAKAVRAGAELRQASLSIVPSTAFASDGGLPFSAGRFDAIVCSLVVSYLNFPGDTLFEMYRVLAPKGRLVISSMKHDADTSKMYFELLEWLHVAPDSELPTGVERETLLQVARNFANSAAELMRIEEEGSFRFYSGEELSDMVCRAGFIQPTIVESFGNPGQAVIVACNKP